jgi:hypothetical protein
MKRFQVVRRPFAFPLLVALFMTACGVEVHTPAPGGNFPDDVTSPANQRPFAPEIVLHVNMASESEAHVWVEMAKPSTDAENDAISYAYTWSVNGVPADFPAGQTAVTARLGPAATAGPFFNERIQEVWAVVVIPFDGYGPGVSAEASATVEFTRTCDPHHPGYLLVLCEGTGFTIPLDSPFDAQGDVTTAISLLVAEYMSSPEASAEHDRTRNFFDLVLKRMMTKSDALTYDPDTYLVRPAYPRDLLDHPYGGYDPEPIFDYCVDVPLVGPLCLHAFVWSVGEEYFGRVFDFSPFIEVNSRLLPNEDVEITVGLSTAFIDILYEPPAQWSLTDIASTTPNYEPQNDLSTYLKAYGSMIYSGLEAVFHLQPSMQSTELLLTLRTISKPLATDLNFDNFKKGPYCNNNLGTTETQPGTAGYLNPQLRPFALNGTPKYAGLISDTTSGTNPGIARLQYYATQPATRPTMASRANGGSGIGRDRIGVGAYPYEFSWIDGRYSDNPNNCLRPADACSSSSGSIQNGGPDYPVPSENCEYSLSLGLVLGVNYTGGNISNNADDATFKISEQITQMIPFTSFNGSLPTNGEPTEIIPVD